MLMIVIVFRVEAEKPVHPFNYIQQYTSKVIIITLNTLTMKYKSEVIKIIVYTAYLKLFNEDFVTISLGRLLQSLIPLIPKMVMRYK